MPAEARIAKFNRLILREIIGILKKLEVDKVQLANRSDFNIESVFNLFTSTTLDKISQTNLITTLSNMGVSCTQQSVQLLLEHYDADADNKLNFWEFSNIFLPVDQELRQRVESRTGSAQKLLSTETRTLVIGLLGRLVDAENMIEVIRNQCKQSEFGSLREIFDEFDWMERGFLTVTEIRRHLDCYPDETQSYRKGGDLNFNFEIELLIRRINKDKLNGRISLSEFLDELSPKL